MGRHRINRLFFTLIEIVIVLALLLFLVAVGGVSLSKALQEQQFETELELVLSRLNRSQDLLMLLNIETEVQLEKGSIKQIPVGTISASYEKMIQRERQQFSQISTITFESHDGETTVANDAGGVVILSFLDRGFRLPYGVLILTSKKGEKRYIPFKGYPAPLSVLDESPDLYRNIDNERAFKEQLTGSTWIQHEG